MVHGPSSYGCTGESGRLRMPNHESLLLQRNTQNTKKQTLFHGLIKINHTHAENFECF